MSEHEEYMPVYNDPMYWSYLNRDKDNKQQTNNSTSNKNTTNTTNKTKSQSQPKKTQSNK